MQCYSLTQGWCLYICFSGFKCCWTLWFPMIGRVYVCIFLLLLFCCLLSRIRRLAGILCIICSLRVYFCSYILQLPAAPLVVSFAFILPRPTLTNCDAKALNLSKLSKSVIFWRPNNASVDVWPAEFVWSRQIHCAIHDGVLGLLHEASESLKSVVPCRCFSNVAES